MAICMNAPSAAVEWPHRTQVTVEDCMFWQPIATAPKDGTRVLATDGALVAVAYVSDEWGWRAWNCEESCVPTDGPGAIHGAWDTAPTHWMPLPAPPEDAK